MKAGALLCVDDLRVAFPHRLGSFVAVEGVSFEVGRGEIFGLVGESGSGKSTIGFAINRLLEAPGRIEAGRVVLGETDLTSLSSEAMTEVRGRRIGMIFQDPMTSLNPLITVGEQISETISTALGVSTPEAWDRAWAILESVGIPDLHVRIKQYPHQYSGGMRQRVVIALALCGDPELLIADEPTTALDVTTQKQILELVRAQCRQRNLATILITHDMGVIAEYSDRVSVLYRGAIVEQGPTGRVLNDPRHTYSRALIASIPRLDQRTDRLVAAVGEAITDATGDIDRWLKLPRPGQREVKEQGPVIRVERLEVGGAEPEFCFGHDQLTRTLGSIQP